MAKRRSRGFGSSPAEHETRAERAAAKAVDDAAYATSETSCRRALFTFQSAAVNLGHYEAETQGAGRSTMAGNRIALAVQRARAHLVEHCLIKR